MKSTDGETTKSQQRSACGERERFKVDSSERSGDGVLQGFFNDSLRAKKEVEILPKKIRQAKKVVENLSQRFQLMPRQITIESALSFPFIGFSGIQAIG